MRNYFNFGGRELYNSDGQDSRDLDLYISGHKTNDVPERNFTFYEVPGRNGSIAEDGRSFKNIELVYENCFFISDNPFDECLQNLKNVLYSKNGYSRLEDSYHPNEYRMAIFRKAITPTMNDANNFGVFDLVFDCKPQRYLKSGSYVTTFTKGSSSSINGIINNPTAFNAKPVLAIWGRGTVNINGYSFIIDNNIPGNYVRIDCDIMDCNNNGTNLNKYVSFMDHKFPVLQPGDNSISGASEITQIRIIPRWFQI